MEPTYFSTTKGFRAWLRRNHARKPEIWVGYYKKGSGKSSMTWAESVDQALCFGWIDGIRKRLDQASYVIRFTPRRPRSIWSTVNIRRARVLTEEGRMHPSGATAFAARIEKKSGIYSYEQSSAELPQSDEDELRRYPAAWKFHQAQPPSYRKMVCWWVLSAKREETRRKRMEKLIAASTKGRRL